MNQNDFRALLSTKSSGGGDGFGRSGSGGKDGGGGGFGGKRNMTESDLEEIRKLSKKPKKKGKKPGSGKRKGGDDDDADATSTKSAAFVYRDRASERRQGVNSDMIDANEYAHFDAEQTKFLGGDMEHTHLVKGLDFALLSQLKREKEKLLQATSAAQKQQQQEQNNSTTSYGQETKSASSLSEKLTFKSRVGRLVYFHAVQSSTMSSILSSSRASEHFLPGRMYYTFNLNASEIESVPVIVQRSKEDCPEPDDVVSGMVSELVISKVGEALSNSSKRHSGAGGGVKKLRKKKKHTGAADGNGGDGDEDMFADPKSTGIGAAGPSIRDESDDEDIFPEVGEYVPIHAREEEQEEEEETKSSHYPAHTDSKSTPGYFSNLSASISAAEQAEKKREEEAEHAWKQTIRKVVATQSQAEREKKERERQAKEAQAGTQIDEYSECYPEYQADAALDSEDDEEKPRKGVDKEDMTAEDAVTEKTRRRKQKQGNKLQTELEKINKILETKK